MRVLIIGSGHRVRQELAQVDRREFDCTIGVNRAAIDFGPVDVHISLHPKEYARRKAGSWFVSFKAHDGVDEIYPYQWEESGDNSGSSGLYAVRYALYALGASQCILAGIGMDQQPHYYTSGDWSSAKYHSDAWKAVAPRLTGKVTSLGGWTKALLEKTNTFEE